MPRLPPLERLLTRFHLPHSPPLRGIDDLRHRRLAHRQFRLPRLHFVRRFQLGHFSLNPPLFALLFPFLQKFLLPRFSTSRFGPASPPPFIFRPHQAIATAGELHRRLPCQPNKPENVGHTHKQQRSGATENRHQQGSAQSVSDHATGARNPTSRRPLDKKDSRRMQKDGTSNQHHRQAHRDHGPQTPPERQFQDTKPNET